MIISKANTKADRPERKNEMRNYEEIAKRIREAQEWDENDCRDLCEAAGLEKEFEEADGEGFEAVVEKAAGILGVEIY